MHRAKGLLAIGWVASALVLGMNGACGGSSPAGTSDSGGTSSSDASSQADAPPAEGGSGTSDVAVDAPVIDAGAAGASDGASDAQHRAFPQVPNTSGKTLDAPVIVTIVASNDMATDGTDTEDNLQGFSDAFPKSAVWSAVANEYHLGAVSSVTHLVGPAIPGGLYEQADLQAYVGGVVADGGAPAPSGETIYLVYLPTGAAFGGAFASDCGYHVGFPSQTDSKGDQVAVVQRCLPDDEETQLGQMTRIASHELVEAATDPLDEGYNLGYAPITPWSASVWLAFENDSHIELADLCSGTRLFEPLDGGPAGGWEFQRIWSNEAAAGGGDPCMPAYDEPYYSVSIPSDWYSASPGATVEIPIIGWSAAATTPWLLRPELENSTAAFADVLDADGGTGAVTLTTSLGIGSSSGCVARDAMNTGVAGTLTVTVPAAAEPGDYGVFFVESRRGDPTGSYPATCYPPLSEDYYHFWPVGVYVQ
jgi:hypothetical protein